MERKKVSLLSIVFVFTMVAIMIVPTYAGLLDNLDWDSGDYVYIEAYVCGYWGQGKLSSPSAYIYVLIEEDLPDNNYLVVYWYFWWVDENFGIHGESDTEEFPDYRYEGQSVKIDASGLPSVVYLMVAEGKAGYDDVWDTDLVRASVPIVEMP